MMLLPTVVTTCSRKRFDLQQAEASQVTQARVHSDAIREVARIKAAMAAAEGLESITLQAVADRDWWRNQLDSFVTFCNDVLSGPPLPDGKDALHAWIRGLRPWHAE